MSALLWILAAAAAGHLAAKALRLPHAPLMILTGGVLDGISAPLEGGYARDALLLGLTFLVFLSATDLDPWRFGRRDLYGLALGGAQFTLIGLAAFGVGSFFNFPLKPSVYIALALAASSALVIVNLLAQRGELYESFGRVITKALLAQGMLMIVIISALSASGKALVGILGLLAGSYFFKRWIAPMLMLKEGVDEESRLIFALGILFLFVGAGWLYGLPFLAGAFFAGLSLSSFPISGLLKGQFASLNSFFSAVFFVVLGYFVDFPSSELLLPVGAFVLLISLLSPLLTAAVSWMGGAPMRSGIEGGLMLAQAGEFSVFLALIGLENGDLGREHLSLVTSVAVSTMILTPFLSNEAVANFLMRRAENLFAKKTMIKRLENHYVLIGCGSSGMVALKKLLLAGAETVVIDDDPGVARAARELGAIAIVGNGKDPEIRARAGADKAKLIVSSMRKFTDNLALLGEGKGVAVNVVRAFDRAEADELEGLGAVAIVSAQAAAEDLLEWMKNQGYLP